MAIAVDYQLGVGGMGVLDMYLCGVPRNYGPTSGGVPCAGTTVGAPLATVLLPLTRGATHGTSTTADG